ncbi:MAG: recombinase family protein [Patescibacteria group bacterium]
MKYIIYCRKSTDTEDKQVLSLDSQENELTRLAKVSGLEVVSILRESKSAKSPDRPIFNEMIKMITSGKADSILCWKIDRLTRNPIDGGQIQWLLQNNKIRCIRTFEKSYYPNDNVLIMSIEQAMANQYIRDLSTNVKRGNREKLSRGEWPNHAPFGYLNDKATKSIVIDPIRSKYIPRMFELYLTGSHGTKSISETLYQEGLRTRTDKKVLKGHIHRILSSVFYTGLMEREGKYYEGKHQPLISKETFEKARDVMHGRIHPRTQKLFFPLRGFLKCENCGCALTASLKKGHQYYYCTGNRENCEEHINYMRENYLYEKISLIFDDLHFSERKIEIMYQAAKERLEFDNDYSEKVLSTLHLQLESLKTKESTLLDTFLAEQITKELYDAKVLALHNERVSFTKQIKEAKARQPACVLEPTKKVFLEASRAKKEFLAGNDLKKRNILENLCWNLSVKDKNIQIVSLKSPFNLMLKAPKNGDISTLLRGLESDQH